MIIESVLIVTFALVLDLILGDPKNRFHPTAWIGMFIAALVPYTKARSPKLERLAGIGLVVLVSSVVVTLLLVLHYTLEMINLGTISFLVSIIVGIILLKTTIAIKGMEKHATLVLKALSVGDLKTARIHLSKIVKRNTTNLDENHIISATIESIGENTVDGITGSLFYFALFGLPGAFVYRTINTIDSMIGYKNSLFSNIGWFGANCDKVLNYLPARITALMMVMAAVLLGNDWKRCYKIMRRDGTITQSPNAGYPMAALAGALGTRFEKINHYTLGEGTMELTKVHLKSAINLMKVTSILFSGLITIPIIVVLALFGWWVHA